MADPRKEGLARLARGWPFRLLLPWWIRLTVPRQRVGVALITFNPSEEVLLFRHVFHPSNPWGLPGGWLGRDEAPGDGLTRELREEAGLAATLGPPIHIVSESPPHHLIVFYLGWLEAGEMKLNREIIEARWFALGELPRPLWPSSERAIAAALPFFRATTPATRPDVLEPVDGLPSSEARQPA
jgi:ADP-ribose pyrophosphatase YjhB (NUDIX family)